MKHRFGELPLFIRFHPSCIFKMEHNMTRNYYYVIRTTPTGQRIRER
uniref:Uncharacterized protein n=1 Tax=Ciona intestinalis TaxID=7719 RepID=H2XSY9_CIOIN